MNTRHLIAVFALVLVSASCKTNYSFGHRDPNCDPDERLERLVKAYDKCRDGCTKGADDLIFDCSSEWLAIERLATEFPRHVPTLMANAVIAYDERDPVKSKRFLDALFSVADSHPDAAVLRSRVALDEGNTPFARRVIETQLQYTPHEPAVHEALSSILYTSGDWEGAAREIDLAEAQGAPSWRVAFNRGLIAEAAGQSEEAQMHFEEAVNHNPDFAPARARLSRARSGS